MVGDGRDPTGGGVQDGMLSRHERVCGEGEIRTVRALLSTTTTKNNKEVKDSEEQRLTVVLCHDDWKTHKEDERNKRTVRNEREMVANGMSRMDC